MDNTRKGKKYFPMVFVNNPQWNEEVKFVIEYNEQSRASAYLRNPIKELCG